MPAREQTWGKYPCCRTSAPHSHPDALVAPKAKHTTWQMPLKGTAGPVREAAVSAWPCKASPGCTHPPAWPVSMGFLPLALYSFFVLLFSLSFNSPASVCDVFTFPIPLWIVLTAHTQFYTHWVMAVQLGHVGPGLWASARWQLTSEGEEGAHTRQPQHQQASR